MKFNIGNLEQYRNNILKKKRGYRFDDNVSIYFISNTWIFAIRNRIRIREKEWGVFRAKVTEIINDGK